MKNKIMTSLWLMLFAFTVAGFGQTVLVSPDNDIENGFDLCDPISITASNAVTVNAANTEYLTEEGGFILLEEGFEATAEGSGYFLATIGSCITSTKEAQKEDLLVHSQLEVFPNPFTSELSFTLNLEREATVNLSLWNETGSLAKELVHQKTLAPGTQSFAFTANDLAPGFYIYRLSVDGYTESGRVACIR